MKPLYTVTLTLGDVTLSGTGDTVLQALEAIDRPAKITTKAILSVSNGEKTSVQVLSIPRTKRMFYPLAQAVISKQLQSTLQ